MTSLTKFEIAYYRLQEIQRQRLAAEGLIFCLCGRAFPDGQVSRTLYGWVHYADNRCPVCEPPTGIVLVAPI